MFVTTGSRALRRRVPVDAMLAQDAAMHTTYRNVCGRNGSFEVWQSATSISVTASATGYTVDGWYLTASANQASTVSRQTGLTLASRYCARVQRNSAQTGTGTMRFAMPLDTEELYRMRGQRVVLSFYVAAGANWSPTSGTLSYTLYVGTGSVAKRNASSYTGETTPISGSVNLTAGGSAIQVVSLISAQIPTNITCAEVQFSWAPTGTASTSDYFDIDDVQLEIVPSGVNSFAPVYERRNVEEELLACYRHFRYFPTNFISVASPGNTFAGTAAYPMSPELRSTPSVSLSVSSSNALTSLGASVATSAMIVLQAVSSANTNTTASFTMTLDSRI